MAIIARTEETNITINLSRKHKQTLEKAAASRCLSLNEYLLQIAFDVTTEELPEVDSLVLSEKDWHILIDALENPPLANEALKSAINDHMVYKRSSGEWVNKKNSASKASSIHSTQKEAEKVAREMLHKSGGDELISKRQDGKICSKDTILPGNDPNLPKNMETISDWDRLSNVLDECKMETGITDFAEQHDHYIHGCARRNKD